MRCSDIECLLDESVLVDLPDDEEPQNEAHDDAVDVQFELGPAGQPSTH